MKTHLAISLCLFAILSGCTFSGFDEYSHAENRRAYEQGDITLFEYLENERDINNYYNDHRQK